MPVNKTIVNGSKSRATDPAAAPGGFDQASFLANLQNDPNFAASIKNSTAQDPFLSGLSALKPAQLDPNKVQASPTAIANGQIAGTVKGAPPPGAVPATSGWTPPATGAGAATTGAATSTQSTGGGAAGGGTGGGTTTDPTAQQKQADAVTAGMQNPYSAKDSIGSVQQAVSQNASTGNYGAAAADLAGAAPGFYNPYQAQEAQLQSKLAALPGYDSSGVQGLSDFATGKTQSPWLTSALQSNTNQTQNNLGQAAAQGNAATQQNLSSLAQGGMSAGAAERATRQGGYNTQSAEQGILNQGNQNALGLQSQAGQQQVNAMSQLPGAQSQAYQSQIAGLAPYLDLGNQALQQGAQGNQFNATTYGIGAQALGAGLTAQGIAAANGQKPTAPPVGPYYKGF